MVNSQAVGREQEQKIVRHARANGFPGADRIIRTGAGKAYSVRADEGDIWLCPGVIVQSKRLSPPSRAEYYIRQWLAETGMQRQAAKADHGILIVRRERYAISDWWAFFTLYGLCTLAGTYDGSQPAELIGAPVRLTVADAYTLLRAAGYGTPAEEGT